MGKRHVKAKARSLHEIASHILVVIQTYYDSKWLYSFVVRLVIKSCRLQFIHYERKHLHMKSKGYDGREYRWWKNIHMAKCCAKVRPLCVRQTFETFEIKKPVNTQLDLGSYICHMRRMIVPTICTEKRYGHESLFSIIITAGISTCVSISWPASSICHGWRSKSFTTYPR